MSDFKVGDKVNMKPYEQWAIVVSNRVIGMICHKTRAWANAREYYGWPSNEWLVEQKAKCIRVRITEAKPKKRKAKR